MSVLARLPHEQEVGDFQADGVVLLPGLVSDKWVSNLGRAIESDAKNASYSADRLFFDGMMGRQRNACFSEYCQESDLPHASAKILKAKKINLLYDQYLVKEPGGSVSQGKTRWHHDQTYWPIRGDQIVTLWLALDCIDDSTGRVEFVKGSHRWPDFYQPEGLTEGDYQYARNPDYKPVPDIDSERDKHQIVSWDMEPGDVLAFHGRTLHGAKGNQNPVRRRRAVAIRYTGEDVTYYNGPGSFSGLLNPNLDNGDPLDSDTFPVVWELEKNPN
jgi:ectoine hydroxylase-related dioxygenase (phytanoyl-CoA dioxygenase family)